MSSMAREKKDLLLSLSEKTLFAELDKDAENDWKRVRDRVKEVAAMLLGDSQLELVELLAVPLLSLPGEPDPVGVKSNLDPAVGLAHWPLGFELTKLGISRDTKTGHFYVTMNLQPDDATRDTLELQLLRDVDMQFYPPLRMFRVSTQGQFRTNRIYIGRDKIPETLLNIRFPLEVQTKNLLLVTAYQTFKLRLCGLESTQNNLQWVDIKTLPKGYRVKDHLPRFKDWGNGGRLRPARQELSETRANTPLGRVCPWLTEERFKDKWANLTSGVELVYTPGVVSKTDKVLSLTDQPQTTRMLRESLLFHYRNQQGDNAFMNAVWSQEGAVMKPEVRDALDTLSKALAETLPTETNIDEVRDTELGFDPLGNRSKRRSYYGARAPVGKLCSHSRGDGEYEESIDGEAEDNYRRLRPPVARNLRRSLSFNDMLTRSLAVGDLQNEKKQYHTHFEDEEIPNYLPEGHNNEWVKGLRLPEPEDTRRWTDLWEWLNSAGETAEKVKALVLSTEFTDLLFRLDAEDRMGIGLNFHELVELGIKDPGVVNVRYLPAPLIDRYWSKRGYSPEQLLTIHFYANVVNMMALMVMHPEEFSDIQIEDVSAGRTPKHPAKLPPPSQVLKTVKRASLDAVHEAKKYRRRALDPRHTRLLAQWETEEIQQVEVPQFAPMGIGYKRNDQLNETESSDLSDDGKVAADEASKPWQSEWADMLDQLPEEVRAGKVCLLPEFYKQLDAIVVDKLPASPQVADDLGHKEVPELFWEVKLAEVWEKLVWLAQKIVHSSARLSVTPTRMDYINAWLLIRRAEPQGSPGDIELRRVMDVWQQLTATPGELEKMSTVSRYPQ